MMLSNLSVSYHLQKDKGKAKEVNIKTPISARITILNTTKKCSSNINSLEKTILQLHHKVKRVISVHWRQLKGSQRENMHLNYSNPQKQQPYNKSTAMKYLLHKSQQIKLNSGWFKLELVFKSDVSKSSYLNIS